MRNAACLLLVVAIAACGSVEQQQIPKCSAGEFVQCDGDNMISCNDTGDGVVPTPCGGFGCNAEAGRCNVCTIGDSECLDADTAKVCADGSGLTDMECQFACNATRNECNVCEPDAKSCRDASTEQICNADGSGFASSNACEFGCNSPEYNQCRTCDPAAGTSQCSPTDPETRITCNSSGFITGGLNCPAVFPGAAPDGCNPATGKCYHE